MSKEINQISKYYKSFSGTDTLAFIMMPGCSPVVIGSLTTISYSMYRNKRPVINIGRTNINGVTRGSRIYAGTMIFTLINQHWLKELQEQIDYIKDFDELKVDELPLFDIMIISANEYGNAVSMYIYGIDFTDEAQTISVEDLFTENTFSFIARDISVFKKINYGVTRGKPHSNISKTNVFTQRLFVLKSSNISLEEVGKLEQQINMGKINYKKKEAVYQLTRDLYYNTSKLMIGNDVSRIQEILSKIYDDVAINGVFDENMNRIIRRYQSDIGEPINGVVDSRLYNFMCNNISINGLKTGLVVNKFGAFVYKNMSMNADITETIPYKKIVEIEAIDGNNENGYFQRWYKVSSGYVLEEDIYSSYYTGTVIEFPTLNYEDKSAYVTLVQESLSLIYPSFKNITGIFDKDTINAIKKIQEENGLYPSGIVDMNTWMILESLSGNINKTMSDDNFNFKYEIAPGVYNINNKKVLSEINSYLISCECKNYINLKMSVICTYPNGKTETKTKTIPVKNLNTFRLSDFKNAFVYNPSQGASPVKVDWIIYPYNKKPYKWTFNYS